MLGSTWYDAQHTEPPAWTVCLWEAIYMIVQKERQQSKLSLRNRFFFFQVCWCMTPCSRERLLLLLLSGANIIGGSIRSNNKERVARGTCASSIFLSLFSLCVSHRELLRHSTRVYFHQHCVPCNPNHTTTYCSYLHRAMPIR